MAKKKKQGSNQLEVQNAAKTLFANIRFMAVDDPIKSIVITSSVPNEGKSTCSVELARAMATAGKRVLLVEADMRRRSLASMLNVRAQAGTYAVLTDAVPLEAAVAPTSTQNLSLLDTEPNIPNPADLIASRRFKRLVETMEERYDYVIFDMPPVGTFVDAAVLSTLADATVMVVRPNLTKRSELAEAYEQLQKANANVIGICATFVEGSGSEYYYAYYTGSGRRVDDKAAAPHAKPEAAAPNASPAGKGPNAGGSAEAGRRARASYSPVVPARSSQSPAGARARRGRR